MDITVKLYVPDQQLAHIAYLKQKGLMGADVTEVVSDQGTDERGNFWNISWTRPDSRISDRAEKPAERLIVL